MSKGSFLAALAVAGLAAPTPALLAQAHLGAQLSFADDADLGIGARLAVEIPQSNLEFAGSADIFFPDDRGGRDVDYWELNGNLLYYFELARETIVSPYAGGGINIARIDVDDGLIGDGGSDTDAGLNLVGGVRFRTESSLRPFVEFRGEIGGGEQVVLTGGLFFF